MEIWYGIANGKILSNFNRVIYPRHTPIFISDDNLSKCQGVLTKLGTCFDMKVILFGIANGQILSVFDSYLPATQ